MGLLNIIKCVQRNRLLLAISIMHPYLKFTSAAGWCDHDFSVNRDTGGWLYRSGMVLKLFVGTSTVRQDRC